MTTEFTKHNVTVVLESRDGTRTDPKFKRWETGLVCEDCGRKAVALTFVKPGDVWDNQKWSRHYVSKHICQQCASRSLAGIFNPIPRRPLGIYEILLIPQAVLFLGAFAILGLNSFLHLPVLVPAIMFLGSIGILIAKYVIIAIKGTGSRQVERASQASLRLSQPLISLENIPFMN